MENISILKFIESLTLIIPTIIAIISIISISIYGWTAGIIILGFVLAMIAVFLDEDIIFPAFIIIVTSTSQIPEQYHHLISYGFSFILLAYWSFLHIRSNTQYIKFDRDVWLFMAAVVSLSFVSSIFSEYYSQGIFATMRQFFFFIIVYILYDWIRSEAQIKKVFFALVLTGIFISVPSIILFTQSGFSVIATDKSLIRFSGFFTGQTALAMNISYTLPVALSMAIYRGKGFLRLFLLFFVVIMMAALFLTFSRAEWISVAISTTILLLTTKLGRRIVFISISLTAGIILFSSTVQDMLIIIFRLESGLTQRGVLWNAAWKIFRDNPLLGTGPWTFKEYVFNYARVIPGTWTSDVVIYSKGGAHNFYLNYAAQLGIGGIVAAIGVIVLYFYKFINALKISNRAEYRYILYPCGAIIAGTFGRSFFQSNGIMTSGWLSMDLYFWVIFIITLRISEIERMRQSA